jgi:hypothetical protein
MTGNGRLHPLPIADAAPASTPDFFNDIRQLPSLMMSRTARSSPEGLGARRHLAAIIDRLPQLPSPLSVKRLQKKADSISVLVYAVARCRAAGPRTLVRI